MKRSYWIQRCEVVSTSVPNLLYEYMGMAEFEFGTQALCLCRIFERQTDVQTLSVDVAGQEVNFWVIAGKGFDFEAYKENLKLLAEEERHMPEPTYLHQVIKGVRPTHSKANAWLDMDNDALFVLSKEDADNLSCALLKIRKTFRL